MSKKKKVAIFGVFIVGILANLVLALMLSFDTIYQPTEEEKMLGEMTSNTLKSEDYKKIEKEDVVSIYTAKTDGVFPYNLEVVVKTKETSYLFMCSNNDCSKIVNAGSFYSNY